MSQTRRLAAILAADAAGYSRLIGADEGDFLQAFRAIRAEQRLRQPDRPRERRRFGAHQGRLRGDLRAARGSEEQVRSYEPAPS
jgi:hypothetical protein